MANNSFQLQYDEMTSVAKNFKDEGEDLVRLHAATRQKVQDLYDEWVGEGAEKFFEEMETNLLPALQRLANSLFNSQDVSNDIMKIIQGADEETAGYFTNQLGGDDFGAGKFSEVSQGLQGGASSTDDFGAGKFGEALGSESSLPGTGTTTGEVPPPPPESAQVPPPAEQLPPEESKVETAAASGGGGSGGGSSSQGLQGDLGKMGAGLVNDVPSQNAASGGGGTGGPANMPDHVYSGGDSPNSGGSQSGSGVSAGSAGGGGSSSSEVGTAAGVAGVAGGAVAVGGGAKALREKKQKSG